MKSANFVVTRENEDQSLNAPEKFKQTKLNITHLREEINYFAYDFQKLLQEVRHIIGPCDMNTHYKLLDTYITETCHFSDFVIMLAP